MKCTMKDDKGQRFGDRINWTNSFWFYNQPLRENFPDNLESLNLSTVTGAEVTWQINCLCNYILPLFFNVFIVLNVYDIYVTDYIII